MTIWMMTIRMIFKEDDDELLSEWLCINVGNPPHLRVGGLVRRMTLGIHIHAPETTNNYIRILNKDHLGRTGFDFEVQRLSSRRLPCRCRRDKSSAISEYLACRIMKQTAL